MSSWVFFFSGWRARQEVRWCRGFADHSGGQASDRQRRLGDTSFVHLPMISVSLKHHLYHSEVLFIHRDFGVYLELSRPVLHLCVQVTSSTDWEDQDGSYDACTLAARLRCKFDLGMTNFWTHVSFYMQYGHAMNTPKPGIISFAHILLIHISYLYCPDWPQNSFQLETFFMPHFPCPMYHPSKRMNVGGLLSLAVATQQNFVSSWSSTEDACRWCTQEAEVSDTFTSKLWNNVLWRL